MKCLLPHIRTDLYLIMVFSILLACFMVTTVVVMTRIMMACFMVTSIMLVSILVLAGIVAVLSTVLA